MSEATASDGSVGGVTPLLASNLRSQEATLGPIHRLFDVYAPGAVFGPGVRAGEHTVITAAEVHVGMGVGYGSGSGSEGDTGGGTGGGGGGGGASAGRPVAAILISPQGVRVEPIVDATKIALAFFTMLGAIFMTWRAMQKQTQA